MFTRALHPKTSGLGLVAIGVIAISFAAPLFKLSAPTHPLIAAATRLSFAAMMWLSVVVIITVKSKTRQPVDISPYRVDREQLKIAIICAVCYAVHFGAWVWSLGLTSIITSATLVTTTPLILGVIGVVTGQDRPTSRLILSGLIAAIGVAGFALEATQSSRDTLAGDALALLGALAMVPYLLLTRRLGARLKLAPFSLYTTGLGALILWVTALFTVPPHLLSLPTGGPLWALLGAALIPQMIGHSTLTLSLRHLTPTEVGIATLIEPAGAALLAWWWMSEVPSTLTLIASFVTLSAVSIALSQPRSYPPSSPSAPASPPP